MALSTSINSAVSDDPGGTVDTFLLAGWFLVPVFTGGTVQVFVPMTDYELNVFFVELAFTEGIMTILINIKESSGGGNAVTGGTADLPTLPDHPYLQGVWNSFALSCRFSTSTMQYMLNRQLLDPNVTFFPPNHMTIHADTGWSIGPGQLPPGFALSDWRFGHGEPFFDLSDSNNVAKLFTAHPVYWGESGERVTGVQPQVYLRGVAAEYLVNRGSLGPWNSGITTALLDVPGPG